MVKLIRFTALLLAAVFTAEAQAAFFPQTTVTQSLGTNLHVNVDSAPSTTVSGTITANQGGTWNLGINQPLPTGSNVIGGVTQSGGPWTLNLTQIAGTAFSLGSKLSASSMPVVIASDQAPIQIKAPINTNGAFGQVTASGTASNFTAPSNTVSVIIQGDANNTDCVRWSFGGNPTATSGMVLQPGQDTGEIKAAATVFFIACSGSQKLNVQWIQSQ